MTIRPAPIDPPEIHRYLWDGFGGKVGWDIGANTGQSLTEMTNRFEQVVAFEPAVECMSFLMPWGQKNNVTIVQAAVSDVDGHVKLAALPDKINTGQLVTPGTHGMEWSIDWDTARADVAREVLSWRIDSLVEELPPPDFCKVDVEGHEKHVLDGAAQVIADYMPNWLLEFHTPELLRQCTALFIDAGYKNLDVVRHPHYRPGTELWHGHGWVKVFRP